MLMSVVLENKNVTVKLPHVKTILEATHTPAREDISPASQLMSVRVIVFTIRKKLRKKKSPVLCTITEKIPISYFRRVSKRNFK